MSSSSVRMSSGSVTMSHRVLQVCLSLVAGGGHLGGLVAEVRHLYVLLVHIVQRVDFGREEADDGDEAVKQQGEGEQGGLVGGVEGGEVGGQEGNPDNQRGAHRYEDVPAETRSQQAAG